MFIYIHYTYIYIEYSIHIDIDIRMLYIYIYTIHTEHTHRHVHVCVQCIYIFIHIVHICIHTCMHACIHTNSNANTNANAKNNIIHFNTIQYNTRQYIGAAISDCTPRVHPAHPAHSAQPVRNAICSHGLITAALYISISISIYEPGPWIATPPPPMLCPLPASPTNLTSASYLQHLGATTSSLDPV